MNKKVVLLFTYLTILPLYGFCHLVGQAKLDSLLKEMPLAKSDASKMNILSNIAMEYANIDPRKGLEYGGKALQLASDIKSNEGVAGAYNCLAHNYLMASILDSALELNLRALQIYDELKNDRKIAITLGFVGVDYGAKSDFSKALEYELRALKKFEELKDNQLTARTLLVITNIYSSLDEAKAIDYDRDALKLYEQIGDKEGIAASLLFLGTIYYQQKEYERALDCLSKALQLSSELGLTKDVEIEIGYIGSTYLGMGNLPLALKYTSEAMKMSRETGDSDRVISAYLDIGRAYLALSKPGYKTKLPDSLASVSKNEFLRKSVLYLEKAKVTNNDRNNLELLYENLESLSEAYEMSGDPRRALENYKVFTQIKDSVFSSAKVTIARQEAKREADLKEKQIEISELTKVNARRRMQFMLAGIGVLLVVTVAVTRTNKKLAAEKRTSEKLRADLEETLEQKDHLLQKLSDSADMKSKFFANVSHELRTPVTILTGMLELMKQKDGEIGKNKLEVALSNSRRLQKMVEEMLDISKEERQISEAKKEIRDIVRIVERIVFSVSSFIEQSKIEFSFEAEGVEGVLVSTDEGKLEKIINNLIYNAIKFNRAGGSIKVLLSLSPDKKWVNIMVADTGMGIDEKDLPHIFDRYYQSSSNNLKVNGVGIGLSLVSEFTALLGGRVSVASKLGEGSSFTLEFPVFEGDAREILADPGDIVIPDVSLDFSTPYSILLVEDNAEMRFYLKEILSGNVSLIEMENGRMALDWLMDNHADMVISDVMMPEMDGREFISILKTDDRLKKIPVIVISALSDQASLLGLLQLGVDDYIVKPFDATELRIRVRNLLNNLRERRVYEEENVEPVDIPENRLAEQFKTKLQEFVLERLKKYDVTVYDVAYEFSISERQLYRLAKSLTGCTPSQLIKEVKLQKAYELAVNRKVSKVETLAKEVGFENTAYFARQFAERFGKKPSEFL